MANDEITNKKPHNEYVKSISGATTNPSPAEASLNSQMNGQYTDSLVSDIPFKQANEVHKDSTDKLPKPSKDVGSEKPIFEGTLHEKMIGGKEGKKQDFKTG